MGKILYFSAFASEHKVSQRNVKVLQLTIRVEFGIKDRFHFRTSSKFPRDTDFKPFKRKKT